MTHDPRTLSPSLLSWLGRIIFFHRAYCMGVDAMNMRVDPIWTKPMARAGRSFRPVVLIPAVNKYKRGVVRDWLYIDGRSPVSLAKIMEATCAFYGVSLAEIKSRYRDDRLVEPRHMAMYLAREITKHSCKQIALFLGRRDSTTAHYAHQKICRQLEDGDRDTLAVINSIRAKLEEGAA